jgi:sucrose-6-phosphate hydrolase SacC (GH32 family)
MWEKDVTNPLISNPPPSYNHMDFRDPYVFEYNGYYYMIIGSGLAGNGGGILFSYRSTDMKNWNFILPIFQHSNVADLGTFWEMAYMFEIRQDTFLFGVGPLGMPKVRALYSLGTFVNNKFVPFVPASEFKDIELVEHNLLAPAFGKDEWGQYVYSGILAEQRSVTDQIAAGWRHTFSLPRRVFICDDGKTLGQYPHPNLCSLRDTLNKVSINNVNISNSQNFIDKDWASQQYEFEGYITNESNGYVVLEFLKDTLSQKSVKLELDFIQNRVVLNRQNSSPYNATQDVQIADYIFANNDSVYLRVFIDHSTIEIFLDNVAVMSARVYPHPAQNQFLIKCLSGSVRVSGSLFPMFGMRDTVNRYTTYCEPTNVPTGYYGYISSGELGDDPQIVLMPNPSLEVLKVRCPVTEDCQYVIYNGQSKIVQRGVFLKEISVEGLPAGSYYLKLSCSEQVLKFIKL